jgi:hypothetical protein
VSQMQRVLKEHVLVAILDSIAPSRRDPFFVWSMLQSWHLEETIPDISETTSTKADSTYY